MATQTRPLLLLRDLDLRRPDLGAVGAWIFGAAVIVYLALRNGGYDAIPREQVGVAVWWIVLIGVAAGVFQPLRAGRPLLLILVPLALYAAWTVASFAWTDSAERTGVEVARVVTYLGFAALAAGLAASGRSRQMANGVFTGCIGIALLAVLSRLHPTWFPEVTTE